MNNTKAYGWAASAIHHVVLLGVGGQASGEERKNEPERPVGDGLLVWGEEAREGGGGC